MKWQKGEREDARDSIAIQVKRDDSTRIAMVLCPIKYVQLYLVGHCSGREVHRSIHRSLGLIVRLRVIPIANAKITIRDCWNSALYCISRFAKKFTVFCHYS